MASFETYGDVCSNSLVNAVGSFFDVYLKSNEDDPVLKGILGIYDVTFLESDVTEVSTATFQPNVLIRDVDLGEINLTRKNYMLHHLDDEILYNIVGILQDDASTTRYFVQKYKKKQRPVEVPET